VELALSEITNNPERVPRAVGVNVTLIVQLLAAETEVPHVWLATKKSQVALIVVIASGTF
jgi:hypothetical protein